MKTFLSYWGLGLIICAGLWADCPADLEAGGFRRQHFRDLGLFREPKVIEFVGLDADGTIRVSKSGAPSANYPTDVRLLPGVADRVRQWNQQRKPVLIFSNQAGLGVEIRDEHGRPSHLTEAIIEQALAYTVDLYAQQGAYFDYFDYAVAYDKFRKPRGGMLDRLRERLREELGREPHLNLKGSIMIGDAGWRRGEVRPDGTPGFDHSNSDRLFGENHGMTFIEPDAPEAFNWRAQGIRRFD